MLQGMMGWQLQLVTGLYSATQMTGDVYKRQVLSSILGLNPLVTIIVATVAGIAIPMIVSKFVIKRFNLLSKIMLGR